MQGKNAKPLTQAQYRALAEFRYQVRKFLRHMEEHNRELGIQPQQYQLVLAVQGLPESQQHGRTGGSLRAARPPAPRARRLRSPPGNVVPYRGGTRLTAPTGQRGPAGTFEERPGSGGFRLAPYPRDQSSQAETLAAVAKVGQDSRQSSSV